MSRPVASFAAAMTAGLLMGGFSDAHALTTAPQFKDFSAGRTDSTSAPSTNTPDSVVFDGFNLLGATQVKAELFLIDPIDPYLATATASITGSEGSSATLVASFRVTNTDLGTPFSDSGLSSGTATNSTNNPAVAHANASDFGASPVTYTSADPNFSKFLDPQVTFAEEVNGFSIGGTCALNDTCTYTASFRGRLELVYTYDLVVDAPEPGSLALYATGCLGLIVTAGRRLTRRSRDLRLASP